MEKKKLRFRKDGTFRVVMMSDLQESAKYDERSLRSVEALLEECDPDLVVLGGGELPVGVRTVEYHEYVMLRTERTEDEAKALALEEAEGSLSVMAGGSDILGVTKEWESADGSVRLRCRVRRIKNIAEQRKIEVSVLP